MLTMVNKNLKYIVSFIIVLWYNISTLNIKKYYKIMDSLTTEP